MAVIESGEMLVVTLDAQSSGLTITDQAARADGRWTRQPFTTGRRYSNR